MKKPHTFIVMGPQGCGKATQIELLQTYYKEQFPNDTLVHFESGQGFRDFLKGDSHTSELVRQTYFHGFIQPDFLAVWLFTNLFVEKLDHNSHMIIDGFPRTVTQARILEQALRFYKRFRSTVIFLYVPEHISTERMEKRGRGDDQDPLAVARRLEWYRHETIPAIQYFKTHPEFKFVEVDATQSIEKVHEDIINNIF